MILKFDFPISYLHEMRTIHMYLPDSYAHANQEYPVLYMFDGHNLFDDDDATYGRAWHIDQELMQSQNECIIVGMECSHNGNQRLIEYSPYPFFDEELGCFDGWGKETMEWVVHELKPYIDQHFPTLTDRNHTWIAGSSCGGLMALYASIKYSFTFSKSLAISPYILPTKEDLLKDIPKAGIHPNTSIYMSWGALEEKDPSFFIQETKGCTQICNALIQKQVQVYLNVREKGKHNEASWQDEAQEYLHFIFKKAER